MSQSKTPFPLLREPHDVPVLFADTGGLLGLAERVLVNAAATYAPSREHAARMLGLSLETLLEKIQQYRGDSVLSQDAPFHQVLQEFLEGEFCWHCGCTEHNPCVDENGIACSWGDIGICTSCTH